MPYTELLKRALDIAWRNRWLWLLALFAGEAGGFSGGGSTGNVQFPGAGGSRGNASGAPDLQPFVRWVQDHAALLELAGAALVVLGVVLFVVSCAAVAAEIKGVEEIDAGRPTGLGRAWSSGTQRFWPVLRLRLLLILIALVAVLIIAALVGVGILAAVSQAWLALVADVYWGLGFVAVYFAFALVLGVMTPVATRAVVMEGRPAIGGLARAYRLLFGRLGRVAACWGLMLACQFVYGIGITLLSLVLALPSIGIVYSVYNGAHLAAAIAVGVVMGVIVAAVLAVAGAAFGAFYSSFWTLAYPRLETA